MSKAEQRALELYPPKYIRETWVRTEPDVNTPLRDAYVKGYNDAIEQVCAYLRLIQDGIDIIDNVSNLFNL